MERTLFILVLFLAPWVALTSLHTNAHGKGDGNVGVVQKNNHSPYDQYFPDCTDVPPMKTESKLKASRPTDPIPKRRVPSSSAHHAPVVSLSSLFYLFSHLTSPPQY